MIISARRWWRVDILVESPFIRSYDYLGKAMVVCRLVKFPSIYGLISQQGDGWRVDLLVESPSIYSPLSQQGDGWRVDLLVKSPSIYSLISQQGDGRRVDLLVKSPSIYSLISQQGDGRRVDLLVKSPSIYSLISQQGDRFRVDLLGYIPIHIQSYISTRRWMACRLTGLNPHPYTVLYLSKVMGGVQTKAAG